MVWRKLEQSPMRFTFYMRETCKHLDSTLDALVSDPQVISVALVTDSPVSKDRLELGWPSTFEGSYEHFFLRERDDVKRYIEASHPEMIHVFIGMRHISCVTVGIRACIKLGRRYGIMHEPRVREGVLGKIRYLQSWLTERPIRKTSLFVLAIGSHGPRWFTQTGYSPSRVFPFAYFVDQAATSIQLREPSPLRVAYVGRLVKEKGILDFISAAKQLDREIEVIIVGAGNREQESRRVAEEHPNIKFIGAIPMAEVQRLLADVDIVVQPSHTTDDGWGVIVSEALLAGCAVVASDVVGASMCLEAPWIGLKVKPRSPKKMRDAITHLKSRNYLNAETRQRRRLWASERLVGKVGAATIIDVVRFVQMGGDRPRHFLSGEGV